MGAIIRHLPITCNGLIYRTYGNSPYPCSPRLLHLLSMCQRQQGKEHGSACRFSTPWLRGILPSSFCRLP